jgi:hypothetical protein
MNFKAALAGLALGAATRATDCWAWGATEHEWISGIAIEKLPDSMPAFVRTPEAAAEIASLAGKPDRSKGAGEEHNAERDPRHFVRLTDSGEVVGVIPLARLPETREAYDTALRAKGFTQEQAGYLPYVIAEGWLQVRKDFAYWRALTKAIETAETPQERAWFETQRSLRERLTVHHIGIWSHHVGDASQPLHVTVHFNGWGDFPNPNGYTDSKQIEGYFEGEFVERNLSRADVAAEVKTYRCCSAPIEIHTGELLFDSFREVVWLYRLEKDGAFAKGDRRGIAFARSRLAAGAAALRDMTAQAWHKSNVPLIGHPGVTVPDIESGKVRATRDLFEGN